MDGVANAAALCVIFRSILVSRVACVVTIAKAISSRYVLDVTSKSTCLKSRDNFLDVVHKRIPAGKVQAKDMDTAELMLATAQRVGKPRK